MAGIGAGFGQADITGNYNRAQANSRASRQQEAKEKEVKILQDYATEKDAQNTSNPVAEQAEQIAGLQQEVKTAKNQAVGKDLQGIFGKAMLIGTSQGTKDALTKLYANPEAMKKAGIEKGDVYVAGNDNKDQMLSYLVTDMGMDVTTITKEDVDKIASDTLGTGQFVMYKGDIVDISKIGKVMGATKGMSEANIERIENQSRFVKDTVSGKSVANESYPEYAKKTIGKNELDTGVDQVKSAINADSAVNPTASQTPTSNADGTTPDEPYRSAAAPRTESDVPLPETVNLDKPIYDINGNELVVGKANVVTTPAGDTAKVSVNADGSRTVTSTQGGTSTVKPDGTVTTIETSGLKSTTTSDGTTVSVAPDGTVSKSTGKLPARVQLAYDLLGISSPDDKAAKAKASAKTASDWVQFANDPRNAGKSMAQLRKEFKATAPLKKSDWELYVDDPSNANKPISQVRREFKANAPSKTTDWDNFYADWLKEPSNKGKTVTDARTDFKASSTTVKEWASFYEDWQKEPRNKGKSITDARRDFKAKDVKTGTDWEIYRKLPENKGKAIEQVRKEFLSKQDPSAPKDPDKLAMDKSYQAKRGEVLTRLDDTRLVNDPDGYTPIKELGDITAAEWESLSEQEYNDLKMAYRNTKSKLSETEKKAYVNAQVTMNAFEKISETYNPKQSGYGQNLLNNIAQFTSMESLSSATISDKAQLNSAINSLIISEASEIGGRPSNKLISMMKDEIGKLNYSDEAVLAKFTAGIDKTVAILEAQKKANPDGYYLQYKGDPLDRMKKIQENIGYANGDGGVNTGNVKLNESQVETQGTLFPKRDK